jgi:hypothetical protein
MFSFLGWFKGAGGLVADRGSVHCPVRKVDTEIDTCFGCSRLIDVTEIDGHLEVRCERPLPPERPTPY